MLKKLFQPKWKSADTQTRLSAVQQLDANQQDILKQVFSHDSVNDIRFAALKQISDDKWLLQQLQHSDLEFSKAIIRRYRQLVDSQDTILALIEQLRNQSKQSDLWLEIVYQLDANSAVFSQVLALIEDSDILVNLVCHANSVDNKLAALAKVQSLEALKTIKKQVKDKRVAQQVRQRLDAAKEKQKAIDEGLAQAEVIANAMAHLAHKAYESADIAKFELLQKQWHELEQQYQDAQRDAYQIALQQAERKFAKLAEQIAKQKLQEQAQQQRQHCVDQLKTLQDALKNCAELSSEEVGAQLESIEQQWQQASTAVDEALTKDYRQQSEQLHTYQQQLEKIELLALPETEATAEHQQLLEAIQQIQWPSGYAQPGKLKELQQYAGLIKQAQQHQRKQLSYIEKRQHELQHKIRAKNLKAANKLMHYLQSKIDELSAPFQQTALQKMERVTEQLQELRDWHEYATNPKREQLVAVMQALVEKEINPEQRFDEIQLLQAEWQSLSASDYQQDQALWEQFKAAADHAFEPCAAYFAEKDSARQLNMQAKQTICAQLEEFKQTVDWQQIDWRALDKILQTAKKEWQAIQNIPYKQARQINQRFNSIVNELTKKLNEERKNNAQARKEVLAKFAPLLALEDVNLAIEKALALKQEWRECGYTFYKDDRKLWGQFQQNMDALFARKKAGQDAVHAQQQQNAEQAQQLIEQIAALSQLEDTALEQSAEQFGELEQQFQQLEDLPKAKQAAIRKRFHAAASAYRQQVAGIALRRQSQLLTTMQQANELCLALETGQQADIEQVQQQFALLDKLPEPIVKRFQSASQGFAAESDATAKAAEITIAIEVLADVPSPEAYREQRTAYQLNQLKQAMTEQLTKEQRLERLLELATEFYGLISVDSVQRIGYAERIKIAQTKLV